MGDRAVRRGGRRVPLALVVLFTLAASAPPMVAGASNDRNAAITVYDVDERYPEAITEGPDGNLWFTTIGWTDTTDPENPVEHPSRIGRLTPDGTATYFDSDWLLTPRNITAGPDGNLWFADFYADAVGRVTPAGVITKFTDPDVDGPMDIVAGPDGNLWFTATSAAGDVPAAIGRITPAGEISTYTHSSIRGPWGITVGPDGALWFANSFLHDGAYSIGRITTAGAVSSFEVLESPQDIATGPDGNLWFTPGPLGGNGIRRMNPSGVVTGEFFSPTISRPSSIAAGPDGNLWFTNTDPFNATHVWIGRITPTGVTAPYEDNRLSTPPQIAPGPGDDMWFTSSNDLIGRIELGPIQTFTDVAATHPFFEDIEWLAGSGITGGFDDGTFRPGGPVTRGSMAAFLYRYAGSPAHIAPAASPFSDVPTNHLFYDEITWLADSGVTGGFADGTFRPGEPVTRGSMAAFLYRFAESPAFTPPASPSFPDVPAAHAFFDEVEWLVDVEVTGGFDDGTYRPGASVTRGSMAAFLHRYDDLP